MLNLTIEKLIYGGDGLARVPVQPLGKRAKEKRPQDDQPRGKAVFVPFVLEGEQIEATVAEDKPGFLRAKAEKVLTPSPQRVEPRCPYFGRCGGCQYQHTSYEHQLEIKTAILVETIRRISKVELPEAPRVHRSEPWNYRNRTRMKVHGGARFALGYYRFNSHELLRVEECPISSPLINKAIAALWQIGRSGSVPTHVEEIELFANEDDTKLLLEMNLYNHAEQAGNDIVGFVSELRKALPAIVGVALFRKEGESLRHEVMPQNLRGTFGADSMKYRTAGYEYQVSVGSFFQTNRFFTNEMVDLVTKGYKGNCALDLYSGVGLFTLPLSQNFIEVSSVEAAPYSYHDLRKNSASNVNTYRATTESFLSGAETLPSFDYVVADPPRGGVGEAVARKLAELAPPQITYVSCDPATLARDLKAFIESGYQIRESHLIDLFPQTFHIESVIKLVR